MMDQKELQSQENTTTRLIPGPPQLPPLYKGQKVQTGPYTVTVTDEMVAQRERENQALYRAWLAQQQRANFPMDDEDFYIGEFQRKSVRSSFVRKVFAILTLQLLFTTATIALFIFEESVKLFVLLHWQIWIAAMILFIVAFCTITCSVKARRNPPFNYILLCLLTLAMSYLSGFISVSYKIETVLLAAGMTSIITFLITAIATFSKFDLTRRSGLVMILGFVTLVAIVVMTIVLIFTHIRLLTLAISVLATLMLSMYLYYDVQTIMGGRKIEINPDEVIFAVTQIYMDIVLSYQYLLMCMGFLNE
ncbi:protein lifeguard 3-like [Prorops nasuta]|uniref:protein lifeguard 3-like n=1 Tax=Prorops nasuta TaxID=863751 RepID=UPI0034CE59CD